MFLLIFIGLIIACWLYLKYVYSYWSRNGFDYIEPSIPAGNLSAIVSGKKSFGLAVSDLYDLTTKPFIGIYLAYRPAILIRDPELAKDILTTNFSSFHDRGVFLDENDPVSHNLFSLKGMEWKILRSKLTPTFTSGRLRNMFSSLEISGKAMQEYLNSILPENGSKVVEMKDVLTRYALDIIVSTIFGLEVNSFTDRDNEFVKIREKAFRNSPSLFGRILVSSVFLFPSFLLFLVKCFPIKNDIGEFMVKVVRQNIEYREKNKFVRKDLIQSLIQLRNTGKININDAIWDVETAAENLKFMSIEGCSAQAHIFFIAGLETSAASTAFLLYELTQNQEILAKVQHDIEESLAKHNGQITYDSIQDMKYLNMCLKETLRKYPGLAVLNRECTEDYQIPGTDKIIKKGTAVAIPAMALQRDPQYFPEPMKFDPERFREPLNSFAYMPFGEGPRHCIGLRMGKMNVLMGIVMLLTRFNVEAVEKKEIEFENFSVGLVPKDGINIRMSKKIQ